MSILGNRVVRKEDPHLLVGGGRYVDSLSLTDAKFVTFVRSTIAHALIRDIDVSAAATAPGVAAVLTAADVNFDDLPPPDFFPFLDKRFLRPPLARDRVRFVGEPVAVVVADDRYRAADAAELVIVDYDPLPAVVDVDTSAAEDVLLFPENGTNVLAQLSGPPVEDVFEGADVVVSQRMVNQRVAAVPLEPRAAAATWDGQRLTFYASTQGMGRIRNMLTSTLGLDPDQVRVIAADVGGGFGAKGQPSPEEILVAWLALRLGGTVRWAETRTENLLAMTHGRGQIQEAEIGATRDGKLVGLRLRILQDGGAYPGIGAGLPVATLLMSSGVYQIPKIEFSATSYATTTTPTGAYRGAGRPEAAYAIERVMDMLADELGLDPAELRRRNFIPSDAFPVTTPVGTTYDCGDYAGALERALQAADYDGLRAEQERQQEQGDARLPRRLLGIGIACYVEITSALGGPEPATVRVNSDGSATVFTGSTPHGQGHVTAWAMVAADRLGIPIERIEVIHGDTDLVPEGQMTGGSRSAQTCGVVVGRAADKVVARARELAADLLEASVDDVVLDSAVGSFHVAGTPAVNVSWTDVVTAAGEPLVAEDTYQGKPTFPFGAHVAVVEVDTETGKVELVRLVGCDDAGRVLNPLLLEGQLHGGMAQGVAQALLEEFRYDADGNPLTSNLADYTAISACELPSFELVIMETPTPVNELGAKGVGESGTIGAPPSVVNAVVDALSHLGVRHIDMPVTPMRVWDALRDRARTPDRV